eukprot:CAMPEP_0176350382 /NCGR_PEP_ID=MMETSP0126-20121128/9433_1 /TAXON_ID=141414 ORGANISM="Strombidinopsis acuminatum, Strain SPMC142" /NCGR_SAMPLE_ID=MMETSP0126 /ASSEMBLY_ACC=CAM_ASM_000229 /LENGTH=70 /DNA_ID=CAMNT_0017700365 /DNA_START=1030 /DNA_END=1242 /DNA_ORIENTATION=+
MIVLDNIEDEDLELQLDSFYPNHANQNVNNSISQSEKSLILLERELLENQKLNKDAVDRQNSALSSIHEA